MQTADSPLQEAELPQKLWQLWEVGKGWEPQGHGDPAVGWLQSIPVPAAAAGGVGS